MESTLLTEQQKRFLKELIYFVEVRNDKTVPINFIKLVQRIETNGSYTKLEKGLLNYWREKYIANAKGTIK